MSEGDDYSADTIQVITSDCNVGYSPTVDPMFLVLGMLSEYMGRPPEIKGSEVIETFYPAEKPVADIFLSYVRKYLEAQKISADIKYSVGPHGHHVFESLKVRELIRTMYSDNYRQSFYGPVHAISEAMFAPLPERLYFKYEAEVVDSRFSYLLGAYIRYGKKGAFQFANASHKIDLIINFLQRLGAKWISRSWTTEGAPQCTIIRFGADDVLARLFNIEPAEDDWKSSFFR